jgi:hypothetical protein
MLLLADEKLAEKEEMKLCKVGFLVKEREKLIIANSIKFNKGCIRMQEENIILTQKKHCENIGIVSPEAVDLTSSRGVTRKTVMPKGQYIAQRAKGAYIAIVCQPEAAFNLSSAA